MAGGTSSVIARISGQATSITAVGSRPSTRQPHRSNRAPEPGLRGRRRERRERPHLCPCRLVEEHGGLVRDQGPTFRRHRGRPELQVGAVAERELVRAERPWLDPHHHRDGRAPHQSESQASAISGSARSCTAFPRCSPRPSRTNDRAARPPAVRARLHRRSGGHPTTLDASPGRSASVAWSTVASWPTPRRIGLSCIAISSHASAVVMPPLRRILREAPGVPAPARIAAARLKATRTGKRWAFRRRPEAPRRVR